MFPKIDPSSTQAWKSLAAEFNNDRKITELFRTEHDRSSQFVIEADDILYDLSRTNISQKELELLLQLAYECRLKEAVEAMFNGEKINETEGRSVLHTALRSSGNELLVDGKNVLDDVRGVRERMKTFTGKVISGEHTGFSGKPINTIINIGIGGSDLGPQMVCEALASFRNHIRPKFVSNIDGAHLAQALSDSDPSTTLFLVASKTFTTLETMTNAFSARQWFLDGGGREEDIPKHFVAISTNTEEVKRFGIPEENMFGFWDWVGGRYSLWSAIGLSIALTTGFENYMKLLSGAETVDKHFRNAPFEKNIPVLMALAGIWHRNFCNYPTLAILPYSQDLHRFPAYLQQADMESNGKTTGRNGEAVNYSTGPVVWGEPGTNGQHAFYQLIHQGTDIIPCDFIGFAKPARGTSAKHHDLLMSNFFAQTEALLKGDDPGNPHRLFTGNRPSTTLLFPELAPENLGKLIALYEHKIFVQGVIWNIFSFDQWGVELGKVLAKSIATEIENEKGSQLHDPSTNALLEAYFRMKH